MTNRNSIVDEKMTLLITAGAAIGANGPDVFSEAAEKLTQLNVSADEITGAFTIGQMVKDRPAAHMEEVADILVGTDFVVETSKTCPASKMDTTTTAYQATMLISAGSAMAANCEPCLNIVVPNLIEAKVSDDDIKQAVAIGKAVKEQVRAQTQEMANVTLHAPRETKAVA